MFENLQERLEGAIKTLKGQGQITEINVATTIKEIRRALVDADVNYKIAKEFTDTVKDEAMGANVLTSVSPGQLMIKIVSDELTKLMGGTAAEINLKGSPSIILISGLQGSGKTTFTHKLAHYLKTKKGRSPLMVACDIYRPAAIDQLKVLGQAIGIPVYSEVENKNAVQIAKNALEYAKVQGYNTIIIDTAGRLAIDEEMMKEIEVVLPQEICDGEYEFKSSIDEEYTKGIVCLYEEKASK
jgi:signal recognition particle subunit SRP54